MAVAVELVVLLISVRLEPTIVSSGQIDVGVLFRTIVSSGQYDVGVKP